MSSQKNNVNTQLEICILFDAFDEKSAVSLIQKIRKNYPSGIKNYSISFTKNNYDDVGGCKNTQIAFMFDSDNQTINNALRLLNKNNILTMSYDPKYLENGIESSLYIGRNVIPYLNIGALRQNGIILDNSLIQISKIYAQGDGR